MTNKIIKDINILSSRPTQGLCIHSNELFVVVLSLRVLTKERVLIAPKNIFFIVCSRETYF